MRVFVLGAGASNHAGYTLAAEVGICLQEWVSSLSPEHDYRLRLKQIYELVRRGQTEADTIYGFDDGCARFARRRFRDTSGLSSERP